MLPSKNCESNKVDLSLRQLGLLNQAEAVGMGTIKKFCVNVNLFIFITDVCYDNYTIKQKETLTNTLYHMSS